MTTKRELEAAARREVRAQVRLDKGRSRVLAKLLKVYPEDYDELSQSMGEELTDDIVQAQYLLLTLRRHLLLRHQGGQPWAVMNALSRHLESLSGVKVERRRGE